MRISFQAIVIKPIMDAARALARSKFDDGSPMYEGVTMCAVKLVPDKAPSPVVIDPKRVDRLVQILSLRDTDAAEIDAVLHTCCVGDPMWEKHGDESLRVIYQKSPDRGRPNAMASALVCRPVYGPALVLSRVNAMAVEKLLCAYAEKAQEAAGWDMAAEAQSRGAPY